MTVTGKFQLLIGRLTQLTNRQSQFFFSHNHESRTKKSRCKRTYKKISIYEVANQQSVISAGSKNKAKVQTNKRKNVNFTII